MKKFIISLCFVLVYIVSACAGQGDSKLRQGNQLYHKNKFQEATQLYSDAVGLEPNRPLYRFNLGDGLYKSGNYPAAAQSFEQSLVTQDKKLEQKVAYNLGNAEFRWGLSQENQDLNKAIELVERSIRHYKRSCELNVQDKDARVNLSIAEEKLKELKEKKKNQPQQSQQQKQEQNKQQDQENQQKQENQQNQQGQQGIENQQNQGQQEKDRKESSGSEQKDQDKQGKSGQEESKQEKPKDQKDGQSGANRNKQENRPSEQKQSGASRQAQEHMSGEEARMLLDGYRQEERMFGTIDDMHKSQSDTVSKDW